MPARDHAARAAWPLLDQGIASLGSFVLTIALARSLSPEEYGIFALVLGAMMILHMVSSSLLFYPMSVTSGAANDEEEARRVRASTLLLLGGFCAPAALSLGLACILMGRADLALPTIAYFLAWQIQEGVRRCLFAELRFAAALPGDAISYLGQIPIIVLLARSGQLSLTSALYAMALTSGLAACLQGMQTGFSAGAGAGARIRAQAGAFWSLGRWSLANNLLSIARVQVLFWLMAALASPAMAALLQAGLNVVNMTNPVVIGLCNIIPQVAARAHPRGKAEAWRAAQPFALSGVPIAILFLVVVMAVPQPILNLIYGAESPYATLSAPLRLLAAGAVAAYATDMLCSYFHGVAAARHALVVNAVGAGVSVVLAIPLTLAYGLNGACLALAFASFVRLLVSQVQFNRLLAQDGPPDPAVRAAEG